MREKELAAFLQQYKGRPLKLMEVCGTHTSALYRTGLRQLLPETITTMPMPYEAPNFYRLSDVEMLSNYAVAYRPDRKLTHSEEALVDTMARLIAKKKRAGTDS